MEIEKYYRKEAKELTDLLFDKGFLDNDLTRESINWLEEYFAFILQSKCQMAEKTALLNRDLKKRFPMNEK